MKFRIVTLAIMIALMTWGCAKTQNNPTSVAQESGSTAESPQIIDEPDFRADLTSKAFPGIHTSVSEKEVEWGTFRKRTLHWHDDVEVYSRIPIFNKETEGFKKINQFMMGLEERFFTQENLSSLWDLEFERHSEKGSDAVLADKFIYVFEVEMTSVTDHFLSVAFKVDNEDSEGLRFAIEGYNFDMDSGTQVELTDIYHKSIDEIRSMVIQAVKDSLDAEGLTEDVIDWDYINTLDHFDFYLSNEGAVVRFDRAAITDWALAPHGLWFTLPLPPELENADR